MRANEPSGPSDPPADPDPRGASDALVGSPLARRVLDALRRHPGASLGELAKELGVSWATVSYHRRRLEEAGLLDAFLDGPRRRFYLRERTEGPDLPAREAMLQGPTLGRIARLVHAEPGIAFDEVAARLAIPPPALRHHLSRLLAAGLLVADNPASPGRLDPSPLLDMLLGPRPGELPASGMRAPLPRADADEPDPGA